MRSRFASIPFTQWPANDRQASASSRTELRKLKIMTGLKTFNSKLPCEPAMPIAASLPITCTQTIVNASHCVGFTLPGMMEEPGSLSGSVSSPRPQRGPEPSHRMSLAIFMRDAASVLSAPLPITSSSCADNAANLFGCEVNGWLVNSAIFRAVSSANSGGAFKPVPTAVNSTVRITRGYIFPNAFFYKIFARNPREKFQNLFLFSNPKTHIFFLCRSLTFSGR